MDRSPLINYIFFMVVSCLTILIFLQGCTAPFKKGGFSGGETIEIKLVSTVNGMRRTALVHIPKGYDRKNSYPLLIVIHGAFSNAKKMEKETGFSLLADRENFVVFYPNGMGVFGLFQHWNGGHCCGKAAEDGLDDVGFLMECIEKAKDEINIDSEKIYMTGFSNGGMMAHRFAAERSETLAAVAVLGASVGGRVGSEEQLWIPSLPKRPVPILLVHGLSDKIVPIEGGTSQKKGGPRQYLSFNQSIDFWRRANECSESFVVEKKQAGNVNIQRWKDCRNNSEVQAYTIEGWGHRWPGLFYTSEINGLKSFNIAEEIWEFFQLFPR